MHATKKSLIGSALCHPIKWIIRFAVVFVVAYLAIKLLSNYLPFLAGFFFHTGFGEAVYYILVAYLSMRWVRRSVQADAEIDALTGMSRAEQKEQNRARNGRGSRFFAVQA